MAKVSPVSIKYLIRAKFTANGVVEKPDIIGAVFGQTEGLLGEDLELRDLQKNGKIGRIEVDVETAEGKTTGRIEIPTALDKTQTTVIAAALETIERIGPADAKIEIEKLEDVRTSKREYVLERAKKLLGEMSLGSPESREIVEAVSSGRREAELIEFGIEKLPAGPDVAHSDEIIVVEGRADVLSLLKAGIKNAIAINGPEVPETLKGLGEKKSITLFVDGDRGGLLVAKKFVDAVKTESIAQAPSGQEVEELVSKEIIQSLRQKVSAKEFFGERERKDERNAEDRKGRRRGFDNREKRGRGRYEERKGFGSRIFTEQPAPHEPVKPTEKEKQKLREMYEKVKGTRDALLLNENLEIIERVSAYDLLDSLYRGERMRKPVAAIAIDGTASVPIIRVSERLGCKFIVAANFSAEHETSIYLLSV